MRVLLVDSHELVFQLVVGESVAPAAAPARPTVREQRVLEHLSEGLTVTAYRRRFLR